MLNFNWIEIAIKIGSLLFGIAIFYGIWTHSINKAVSVNTQVIASKHKDSISKDNTKLSNAIDRYTNTNVPDYMGTLNIPEPINKIPLGEVEPLTPFIPDEVYDDEQD